MASAFRNSDLALSHSSREHMGTNDVYAEVSSDMREWGMYHYGQWAHAVKVSLYYLVAAISFTSCLRFPLHHVGRCEQECEVHDLCTCNLAV